MEKLPELQEQKFTKKVQKLRSYTERIYREISFVTESQHHQIPKLVDELLNVVSEPTMEAVCVEPAERTHEYELLEIQALKILAKRAMQQYQNGECISSEQAMQHFKRFIV